MNKLTFAFCGFLLGCATIFASNRLAAFASEDSSSESQMRKAIMNAAFARLGAPYVWDHSGPNTFDCSGFVYYISKSVLGSKAFPLKYELKDLPGYSAQSVYYRDQLEDAGAHISCLHAKAGDIVFFPAIGRGTNHIGFVSSDSRSSFITAQNRSIGVAVMSFGNGTYWAHHNPACYHNVWIDRALKSR